MKTITLFILVISMTAGLFAQNYNSTTASIETTEMQVFYEGIPIEINAQAIGYREVKLSVPSPYTAPAGSAGQSITVTCTGITLNGKEVPLGSKIFRVKKAPKPEVYWGSSLSGEKVNEISANLRVGYGDNVPFGIGKDNFKVVKYYIVVSGMKGTLEGEGSEISELHLGALKALPKGNKVSIQVICSGPYNGTVDALFEL
jgi:hypothetical protein